MKFGWRGALGLLLSALFLVWALRNVSIQDVWNVLRQSNVALFLLSAVVATAVFPLRARRWKIILEPIDPNIPFGPLWRATAIGMMVNNVAPARLGELARAYALTREVRSVGLVSSFASLALDRSFDAIVLMALMVGAMFVPTFPGDTLIGGQPASRYAALAGLGVLALLVLLYAIVFFPQVLLNVYDRLTVRFTSRLRDHGRNALINFTSGLAALRSPGHFLAILWWTLLHWLVNALAFWIAFKAVGITAPFSAALFVQGVVAIGVSVPSSPGFVGVFEAGAKVGLTVYGVDDTVILGWALGFHFLSFIPITIIGGWYFSRLGLHFKDLKGPPADQ